MGSSNRTAYAPVPCLGCAAGLSIVLQHCNPQPCQSVPHTPLLSTLQQGYLARRQEKIDFWDNVYGFDMSSIKQRALIEPLVDSVDPEQIATNSCQMKAINILDMKVSDAEFEVMIPITQPLPAASHKFFLWPDPDQSPANASPRVMHDRMLVTQSNEGSIAEASCAAHAATSNCDTVQLQYAAYMYAACRSTVISNIITRCNITLDNMHASRLGTAMPLSSRSSIAFACMSSPP